MEVWFILTICHSPHHPAINTPSPPQGEVLDNIQKQVERATGFVQGGTAAVVDAKNYQKSSRKVSVEHVWADGMIGLADG